MPILILPLSLFNFNLKILIFQNTQTALVRFFFYRTKNEEPGDAANKNSKFGNFKFQNFKFQKKGKFEI